MRLPRRPWQIRVAALSARLFPFLASADRGRGGHDAYFAALSGALTRAGIAEPTLVIDRVRLVANIEAVRRTLASSALRLRVVTKSLPAPALLAAVMSGMGTDRMMVFNGVMLEEILAFRPAGDVLLGRPLPAAQVAAFVRSHVGDVRSAAQPQWLVDSPRRLSQYMAVARSVGAPMRVNFEIDVGLHRGGFTGPAQLAEAIAAARAEPLIEIAGLMGYDPQVVGDPDPAAAVVRGVSLYGRYSDVLAEILGGDPARFTLNTAGSGTFSLHLDDRVANEVSVGSAFVKPLNFDLPTLKDLAPAAFVVQPVLKALDPALIPRLEPFAADLARLDPNSARGFFLYGGYGDARPVSPRGLRYSPLYGGRALLTGSAGVELDQDDLVFLRPTESEGVFLQFGDIAVYDGQEIAERWPTFRVSA
jgi:D-serine deaminase-like pyridoxal phosphate-dependent protein